MQWVEEVVILWWPLIQGLPSRHTSTKWERRRHEDRPCLTPSSTEGNVRSGVLLHKQLIRPMVDYVCPIWRSAACSHVRKLQVLQPKGLRSETNAFWYVRNRQTHENLGVPFFTEHIRALAVSFDSKPMRQPLSSATWKVLVPTEGWLKSPTDNRRKRLLRRPAAAVPKNAVVSTQWLISNYSVTLSEVVTFPQVVREMSGYNWILAGPAFSNTGGSQPKWFPPPKLQRPSAKAIPPLLGSLLEKRQP
jgi:hypothetical protein